MLKLVIENGSCKLYILQYNLVMTTELPRRLAETARKMAWAGVVVFQEPYGGREKRLVEHQSNQLAHTVTVDHLVSTTDQTSTIVYQSGSRPQR
jgi:hypothetical protein